MAKSITNLYSGPASKVEVSGSTMTGLLDIGYCESAKISWEPQSVQLIDGQLYNSNGLGKAEISCRQSDLATVATTGSLLRAAECYYKITAVTGKTYVCGPALSVMTVDRPFGAGESGLVKFSMQKFVANESDFVTIA